MDFKETKPQPIGESETMERTAYVGYIGSSYYINRWAKASGISIEI